MSIEEAIENAQQKVANAYTAVENKGGTLPETQNLSNLPTAINTISTAGTVETLNVTPSTSAQQFVPTGGVDGYNPVNVSAVTSSIDANITAGNIKDGVTILGVTGNFDPSPTIDSLSVTPSTSAQTITASGGVDGYSPVTVSAVTSAIDPNITPNKIRNGVNILGVVGEYGDPLPPPNFAVSDNTTWYIDNDGDLYGCGDNDYGQQGSGKTTDVRTFTKRASNVEKVVCSNNTTWYITKDGDLYGCGRNATGQQGDNSTSDVTTFTKRASNIKDVVCSNYSTWYITNNGDLYGCGNATVQGSGDTSNVLVFTQRATNVAKFFCSQNTAWYITNDGELYGCGSNSGYAQGVNDTTTIRTFTQKASNVKDVVSGQYATWYITNDDELYGCGYNHSGAQGIGNLTTIVPTFTLKATNVKKVSYSDTTQTTDNGATWYITNNGDLYGCGYNVFGQQGSNSTSNITTFTKRAENVLDVVSSASSGQYATWYITNDGDLYGCGANNSSQQGSGGTGTIKTFTKRASNAIVLFPSGATTWYRNYEGLYGCGENGDGQQGSGNTTDVTTFTKRN